MPMDKTLAEIYGTNTPDDADVEKLAAAQLAESLAGGEQLDVDGLDEAQIEALAQEVLGDPSAANAETATEGDEGEGQQKVAEADYLGRVMAHAFVQEQRNIVKEAGYDDDTPRSAKHQRVENREAHGPKQISRTGKAKHKVHDLALKAKGKAGETAGKVGKFVAKHPKKFGAGAAVAALGAGAAAGRMSKKASAVDTLAEQRALEILAENGIAVEAQQEKEAAATPYDALAQVVEQKAVELLQANGYTFSED